MKLFKLKFTLILFGIFFTLICEAEDGKSLFTKLCTPCHTIGRGRLVGPDLQNITATKKRSWLIPFIQSSQTVISGGNKEAKALFEKFNKIMMPDQHLSNAQVESILGYIESQSSADKQANVQTSAVDMLSTTTNKNVSEGLLLFSGKKGLKNGGIVCISCHTIKDDKLFSGGTLAKELTQSYGTMGSAGISAILQSPPFPAMAETYKNNPLTKEEILNLTAYLRSVNKNHYYQHPVDFSIKFALLGVFFFVLLNIIILLLYFRRKKNAVNQKIFSRQSSVIN